MRLEAREQCTICIRFWAARSHWLAANSRLGKLYRYLRIQTPGPHAMPARRGLAWLLSLLLHFPSTTHPMARSLPWRRGRQPPPSAVRNGRQIKAKGTSYCTRRGVHYHCSHYSNGKLKLILAGLPVAQVSLPRLQPTQNGGISYVQKHYASIIRSRGTVQVDSSCYL
jgi:hypothetical protein